MKLFTYHHGGGGKWGIGGLCLQGQANLIEYEMPLAEDHMQSLHFTEN